MEKDYHKTTINIPNEIYNDLKRECKVLGINFNALVLIKLNEAKKQNDALKALQQSLLIIEKSNKTNNEK